MIHLGKVTMRARRFRSIIWMFSIKSNRPRRTCNCAIWKTIRRCSICSGAAVFSGRRQCSVINLTKVKLFPFKRQDLWRNPICMRPQTTNRHVRCGPIQSRSVFIYTQWADWDREWPSGWSWRWNRDEGWETANCELIKGIRERILTLEYCKKAVYFSSRQGSSSQSSFRVRYSCRAAHYSHLQFNGGGIGPRIR